jgi:glutamyl-Q tRNA(Asp) synthetase
VTYIGRFAPSPTGPLHTGSLIAAVASYLHARQNHGQWLVRIEDIDPPREVAGAADLILSTLEALSLEWDGPVLRQSSRLPAYKAVTDELLRSGRAFRCSCSRRDIVEATGGERRYPGTCRNVRSHAGPTSVRMQVSEEIIEFEDRLQGTILQSIAATDGDYLIFRRDGLPAYHLAVVVDDAEQRVTDIVRGIDLLSSTPLHIHLQRALALPTPRYWHLPVIENSEGQKLSKQSGATALDPDAAPRHAFDAMCYLGAAPPAELDGAPADAIWAWALEHWAIDALADRKSIPLRPAPT